MLYIYIKCDQLICRQLKEKYMYTEHCNNQQNVPELLKAILQQNSNVFRGPSSTFLQEGKIAISYHIFKILYLLPNYTFFQIF